jgi:2-alkyl-3-oxoalkanoate reductase
MATRRIAITGATGILGSWVLATALRRGIDGVAIMRDADVGQARRRLRAVLASAGVRDAGDRVEIVQGDATDERFGLPEADQDRLGASVDGLIHCAACTSFSSKRDAEVMNTNVHGTQNALAFAAATGTPLYHVSTAYVCGRSHGTVLETDLEHDAGFNNTYENSKNIAETYVREAFAGGSVTGAVFRPSIIVGASGCGRISEFSNFYQFVQAVEYSVSLAAGNGNRVCILGDPGCSKNLIPVDWAAAQLLDAIETDGASGKTYHITHPQPTNMGAIAAWLNELFADSGVRIELTASMEDLDGIMQRATKMLKGYVMHEPTFDRTHIDGATRHGAECPPITNAYLTTLYRYAKSRDWKSVFDRLRSDDAVASSQAYASAL